MFLRLNSLTVLLSLFAMIILTACSSTETVEQEAFGMIETFEVDKKTGLKDGSFTKSSPDGVLIEQATYRKDNLEGLRTIYYGNGNPEIEEKYESGTLNGRYRTYYEDKTVEIEGNYTSGVMMGTWKRFYENGQVMEEVTFEDNLENGPFIEYHPNGKLKAEGQYYNGDNEHGLLKLYDENGELYRRMECDSGVCKTTWLRPGYEEKEENG